MSKRIAEAIRMLCRERGTQRTICPSDVARALESDEQAWRALMPEVREVAARLAKAGEIVVTQRGRVVDIGTARGPVRLRLGDQPPLRGAARQRSEQ